MSDGANTGVSPNLKPPWKKGESGNPAGRPKGDAWFRKLCRRRTVKALKALDASLEDPDTRVSAAKALLEFGWGKAPQVVVMPDESESGPMSDDDASALEQQLDS